MSQINSDEKYDSDEKYADEKYADEKYSDEKYDSDEKYADEKYDSDDEKYESEKLKISNTHGYNYDTGSWHCIECGIDMGPTNPRQLCGKSRCYIFG